MRVNHTDILHCPQIFFFGGCPAIYLRGWCIRDVRRSSRNRRRSGSVYGDKQKTKRTSARAANFREGAYRFDGDTSYIRFYRLGWQYLRFGCSPCQRTSRCRSGIPCEDNESTGADGSAPPIARYGRIIVYPCSKKALETASNLYGMTVNPYDSGLTPGGSSGGESALISMRGSVLGIGRDIGRHIKVVIRIHPELNLLGRWLNS